MPERIDAATRAGFDAVECHFPYEHDAAEIKAVLDKHHLRMVGINTALGPEGCFGLAAVAGKQAQARALIDQAIDYAVAIGALNINVVAGLTNSQSGDGRAVGEPVYRENLAYACERAAAHGKTIVIEPLNPRAVADYHFSTVEQAVNTISAVGADNLKLMLDYYHVQIVQGDLETVTREYANFIGHIQISAVHDRGEPDQGEIYYPYLLGVLSAAGYSGYIGAEYKPRGDSVEAGLSWLAEFRAVQTT